MAACVGGGTGDGAADPDGRGVDPADLDGREFVSTSATEGGVSLLLVPGTRIALSFRERRLGAPPTVALDGNRLTVRTETVELTLLDREIAGPDRLPASSWTRPGGSDFTPAKLRRGHTVGPRRAESLCQDEGVGGRPFATHRRRFGHPRFMREAGKVRSQRSASTGDRSRRLDRREADWNVIANRSQSRPHRVPLRRATQFIVAVALCDTWIAREP